MGNTSILPRMGASAGLNVPSRSLVSPSLFGYALAQFHDSTARHQCPFLGLGSHFMQSLIGAWLTLPSFKPLHPKKAHLDRLFILRSLWEK